MMLAIDIDKLKHLLLFDAKQPLIFSSGLFLFLFLGFIVFYVIMHKTFTLRFLYVTVFSCYFYYKSCGGYYDPHTDTTYYYFYLLLFAAAWDFFMAQAISKEQDKLRRKIFLILSIGTNLGMLCFFKYTNFLFDLFYEALNKPFSPFNIVLPVGISFFTFQSLSYTIDVYRGNVKPLTKFIDYAFYVSFFPQLVAGPIVRARDFLPQMRKPLLITNEMFGRGVFLILTGLFKKAVISDYISVNYVDRIFDNPTLYTGIENLFGVYGYAMQIYCDFSGYSDMAIGFALLLGYHFNINFDSPYKSASITEFWRRWHISLSTWLKDYLYISLGGNRKGKIRTYINLITTMLLGGLWHGASLRFIFWGALHGFSLAIHKLFITLFPQWNRQTTDSRVPFWRRLLGIFITFHIVCLGWVFFRAKTFEYGFDVLKQIGTNFHSEFFADLLKGYPYVFAIMALGYFLHFTPKKWEDFTQKIVIEMPLWLKALTVTALIVFIMQVKDMDIQAFIYFQF